MRNPFRRPAAPEARSISSVPWDFQGGTDSGVRVTPLTAMQNDAVWACVGLIADTISTLPVDVIRGSGASRVVVPTPITIAQPSARLDLIDWTAQAVTSLCLRGEAFGMVTAVDAAMRPMAVEWLDPSCVDVLELSSLLPPTYFVDGQEVPNNRIVHLRERTLPGSVRGLSPVEYHAETMGLGIAAKKYGAQWFGQGAHPSAILSSDQKLTPEQAQSMKERFLASVRGKREPAVLGAGITYTAIQVAAEQSQFLATIGANATQIARIFRVPPEMIGAPVEGSGLTYANREQRWQDFVNIALIPRITRVERLLTSMTPRPQSVKFNLGALLRGDLKTRYEAHAIGIGSKFLTPNEARALEDLPPLEGGDSFPAPPAPPAPPSDAPPGDTDAA